MGTFIEIILLLFIAAFLVVQNKGNLTDLLGRRRKIILDSCALIDGRVVEIVRHGFVADELVIPEFILNELQLLADGNDGHKRERARFGLDIAHELQDSTFDAKVTIDRTTFPGVPATDDKLIQLAKKQRAYLYTTDYNLAKVAAIEAVAIMNVNELAQALRPVALPGEVIKIKIVQKGSNANQGVGYLDDGTMIVVEGGARYVGRLAEVTVTRMHQTVAGKMVFGQVKEERQERRDEPAQNQQQQRTQQQAQKVLQAHQAMAAAAQQQQAPAPPKTRLHDRLNRSRNSAQSQAKKAPVTVQEAPAQQSSSGQRRRRPLNVL